MVPNKSLLSSVLRSSVTSCHHPTNNRSDYRIIPWVSLLYLLSFLDRTNIGNANLFGLSKDLHLTSTQYAACLACFFVFYVLFEGELKLS